MAAARGAALELLLETVASFEGSDSRLTRQQVTERHDTHPFAKHRLHSRINLLRSAKASASGSVTSGDVLVHYGSGTRSVSSIYDTSLLPTCIPWL